MRARWLYTLLALIVAVIGLACTAVPAASGTAASTRALILSHAPGGKQVPPIPGISARGPFYVALGASESLGIQPRPNNQSDMGDAIHGKYAHTGGPTKVGYANDITAATRGRWPHLRLVQFGCSGITVVAAYEGGSTCHYSDGSQIATAVHFLRNHPGETDLITLDFGYNDIWPCLTDRTVNQQCVNDVMTTLHRDLRHAIADLQTAAGNKTTIVGLKHNNPSLADWLQPEAGRQFANESAGVFQRLNDTLGSIFRAAGVKVADVPPYWGIGSDRQATLTGYGLVPVDVAEVCEASWVCSQGNIHPNAKGYRKIANAVLAALQAR
jgi:lysophospholipase L1-like esterase